MKITKSQLKQIIKEEISKVLNEGIPATQYWYITGWPRGIEDFGEVESAGGFKTVLAAATDTGALELLKSDPIMITGEYDDIAHFTVHKAIRGKKNGARDAVNPPHAVKKDGSVWTPDVRLDPLTAYGGIQEGIDNGRLPKRN